MKKFLRHVFNLGILDKKRMGWVDYLRGIAIFLVVYRHVLIGIQRSGIVMPADLVTANLVFFSFRIPLFFILSGIFITGSLAKKRPASLIGIKFENLLYPYLIWSVIQITVQIALSKFSNSDRGLIDYSYILYQPRNLDQFWYLPALFNVSVLYILVKWKLKPAAWVQLLAGLVLYFMSPLFQQVSMMSDWMEFYIFFAIGDALSGIFFREKVQRYLKSALCLLAILPVFAAAQWYYLTFQVNQAEFLVIALIGCLTMFQLAFRLEALNILRFLRIAGFHSLYIYVMHVLASAAVRVLLVKYGGIHDPVVLLVAGIVSGVILPIIFYNLLVKDNILWFLFSYRKSKPVKPAGADVSLQSPPGLAQQGIVKS